MKNEKENFPQKKEYILSARAMFTNPIISAHEFTGCTNSENISFEDEPIFDESGDREQLMGVDKYGTSILGMKRKPYKPDGTK